MMLQLFALQLLIVELELKRNNEEDDIPEVAYEDIDDLYATKNIPSRPTHSFDPIEIE